MLWPAAAFADGVPSCSAEFAAQADPDPLPPGDYLLRVHPDHNLHEVLVVREFEVPSGEVTRTFQREVRRGAPAGALASQSAQGADWHFSQVRHIIRRAAELYQERRGWKESFIEKLLFYARNYINDTVFVEVRDGRLGPLRAAERFIVAPYALVDGKRAPEGSVVQALYGADFDHFREPDERQPDTELPRPPSKLPEAAYLHLEFPLSTWKVHGQGLECGLEVEVGSYFVEQTDLPRMHDIWKAELWIQLLRFAHNEFFDDGFNYNGIVFHTYGNRHSVILYTPLGFEKLRDYNLNGKSVHFDDDVEPTPIIAEDGGRWTPLIYFTGSLDQASARAASGTGWFAQGDYFRKRLGEKITRHGFGDHSPAALVAWESMLSALESEDENTAMFAAGALTRFAELQRIHYETLVKSRANPRRAELALRSYEALNPILLRMEKALLRLVQSGSAATRRHISNMVPSLVAGANRRNFLKRDTLLRDFICAQFADQDKLVAIYSAFWLRNEYKFDEILSTLGGYWPEFDGPRELEVVQARALEQLHAQGLLDAEIDEVVETIHEGMTLPMFLVDPHNPNLSYQKDSHIQAMGWILSDHSRGKAQVVRDLLILTAARHSPP